MGSNGAYVKVDDATGTHIITGSFYSSLAGFWVYPIGISPDDLTIIVTGFDGVSSKPNFAKLDPTTLATVTSVQYTDATFSQYYFSHIDFPNNTHFLA